MEIWLCATARIRFKSNNVAVFVKADNPMRARKKQAMHKHAIAIKGGGSVAF